MLLSEILSPLWAGDLDHLKSVADRWIDSGDGTIAEPETFVVGRVGVVLIDGVVLKSGWDRLALEIETACFDPEIEILLLAINSCGQEWEGGGKVFSALREARRHVLTTAFVNCAHGLAINLALECQVVFACPTAEIGNLCGGYPFGDYPGWPSEQATERTLANTLLEGERRISRRAINRLSSGVMNGEQAESVGVVDYLHGMFDVTADFLNTIGANK